MSYGKIPSTSDRPLQGEPPSRKEDHNSMALGALAITVILIGAISGSGVFAGAGIVLFIWALLA